MPNQNNKNDFSCKHSFFFQYDPFLLNEKSQIKKVTKHVLHCFVFWVKPPNIGHLRVFKNVSVIKRCPLLGGSLTNIVTFGTKHFVRYSRHVHYLGYPLLVGFTVLLLCCRPSDPKSFSRLPRQQKISYLCLVLSRNSDRKTLQLLIRITSGPATRIRKWIQSSQFKQT